MSGSPAPHVAHIASDAAWSTTATAIICLAIAFLAALVAQHTYVKHGRLSLRQMRAPLAGLLAVALAATAAPTPGFAQSPIGPMGLPDLVSDPSFIWIEQDRTHPVDGRVMSTLAFDGILHNIGAGALELAGNPQIEGGVKQRVFDGEVWEDVGEPLIRYETDDGHNHFHLMNAAEYSLWNEGQTEQLDIGAKVGFCLLDTVQIEFGVEAAYLLNDINYCNIDEPDSTDLRMGISPGWSDVYEASVTFQWIDVSNTLPGRYWVGAEIDPTNQIVESNEENNGVVFSSNKYAVSGYNARSLAPQIPGEITLKSTVYGTVGQRAFVITEPPEHGRLSVPTGADLLTDTVVYIPDPGHEGADSFSYFAHDTDTPFPFEPLVVAVDVETENAEPAGPPDAEALAGVTVTAPSESIAAARYERLSINMEVTGLADDSAVQWYAKELPAGLVIDPATGQITGELTMPGETASTIIAQVDGSDIETAVTWTVADAPQATLRSINDFSTILDRRDIVLGSGTAATTYQGVGMPEGMILTAGQPSLLGAPTEAGTFAITVDELADGAVVDTVTFTLTVRPSATPQFAL